MQETIPIMNEKMKNSRKFRQTVQNLLTRPDLHVRLHPLLFAKAVPV